MQISIVLGTRPEIIKMSPIIRELEHQGRSYFILHTGQHYTRDMDAVFLEGLNLPQPKYNLGVGSGTHAEETGKMLIGIEEVQSPVLSVTMRLAGRRHRSRTRGDIR